MSQEDGYGPSSGCLVDWIFLTRASARSHIGGDRRFRNYWRNVDSWTMRKNGWHGEEQID